MVAYQPAEGLLDPQGDLRHLPKQVDCSPLPGGAQRMEGLCSPDDSTSHRRSTLNA